MKFKILASVLGPLFQYLRPAIQIFTTKWGRTLMQIALEAVRESERQRSTADGFTREEKIAFTVNAIERRRGEFQTGKPIADRVIQLAINLAVLYLQPQAEKTSSR